MTLRGLYAITSEALCREPARLAPAVAAALRGGAVLIQYRDKWNAPAQREALARTLLRLCRQQGARLIVNDDAALAARIGADGVHLGANDGDLRAARRLLGPDAVVGATCGDSLARARAAADDGASYVAFGRYFPSRTKPDAPPAQLETLRAAAALGLPRCAIGGLTPHNAPEVIAAGADLVAAIGGVFDAPDIETAARAYVACFTHEPTTRIP
ncbi:MAG TPA: thiamine phosphate synthase [Solimonas sp.]